MSNPLSNESPQPAAGSPPRQNGLRWKVSAAALTFLAAVLCMGFSRWLYRPAPPVNNTSESLKLPLNLFATWPKNADKTVKKPDLVLVLSAQQYGYLLPCGCSRPQKGGLERRYNFMELLRAKGWPLMAVDLGNIAQKDSPVEQLPNQQQIIKYTYSMQALKDMGYTAVGVGPVEASNLFKIYGQYALQGDKPYTLAANLRERDKYPGIEEWTETTPPGTNIKVGVTSIVGAFISEHRPKSDPVQFDFGGPRLKALQAKSQKTDLRVLLYEGFTDRGDVKLQKSEAVICSEAFPEYQVVVALSETDEPPGNPIVVKQPKGNSIIVTLGHKGKYVGVVGVYKPAKQGDPYELHYQLVEMGEEYLTPANQEPNQPILKLMEQYAQELKRDNYLAKYTPRKHPLQASFPGSVKPEFAGTDACIRCHAAAFRTWTKSGHSQAYKTLENAKRPSNRVYDAECIVCHTVGFGYDSGFENATKTEMLKNVGCESCHGPASEHIKAEDAKNGNVKAWRQAINPWKYLPATVNKNRQIEDMCIKCHDHENDVHWTGPDAFLERWVKIQHYTPPKNKPVTAPAVPEK